MRELVLNHASVTASDLETATLWLKQLAISLMSLKRRGIGKSELRMAHHLFEIKCTDSATMYDALLTLRNIGARDEYLYLCRMSSKAPLLESVGEGVMDRFTALRSDWRRGSYDVARRWRTIALLRDS